MPSPLDQPEQDTPRARTPDDAPATVTPALAIEAPNQQPQPQSSADEGVQTLDVGGGDVVKLDKLGPMIINTDGTMSRIQNWQDLHPIEQERTVRLLVKKRNLVRMKKLDQEGQGEGEVKVSALQEAEDQAQGTGAAGGSGMAEQK